jgi:hypothetical protein
MSHRSHPVGENDVLPRQVVSGDRAGPWTRWRLYLFGTTAAGRVCGQLRVKRCPAQPQLNSGAIIGPGIVACCSFVLDVPYNARPLLSYNAIGDNL